VLTGDKKETAIEIGKSCKLIQESDIMDCIDLTSDSDTPDTRETFRLKFEMLYVAYENTRNKKEKKIYMIIDGSNLTYVLADEKFSQKFFKLGLNANSVICCRVSPKQKSLIVKLAKDNGDWITLSIGDGANDVPMIMEAHIGVGIAGKEGSQVMLILNLLN
jgi:magnesium-transporting ATPase (P-type)